MKYCSLTAALVCSAVVAAGALPACGGNSYSSGGFAEIQVIVDNQEASGDTMTVAFPTAFQSSVIKPVQIINPGNRTLTIDTIDWDRDESGKAIVNPYVSIDWKNNIADFPVDLAGLDSVGLNFDVVFEPPLGQALDDFSDSVLLITSNGRSDKGEELVPEVRITFTVPAEACAPQASPDNVTLTATPVSPDSQDFCVTNNPELASSGFKVTGIALENTSNEFFLDVVDNLPGDVYEPGAPAYEDLADFDCPGVKFKVTYQPVDLEGDDHIRVFAYHDCSDAPLIYDIYGKLSETGTWDVTYSHTQAFDFSNEVDNTAKTRSALVTALGPGVITVKDHPLIEDEAAAAFFEWTAWKDPTTPDGEAQQVHAKEGAPDGALKFPRVIKVGESLRFDITYAPQAGVEPPNGQLVIPLQTPDPDEIRLDLFAGTPKARIDLAPVTGSVTVTTELGESHDGERHVVISNHGNGDLEIKGLGITNANPALPADNWTILGVTPQDAPFTLAADEIAVVTVGWDTAGVTDPDGETELLDVNYFDAFVGEDIDESIALVMLPAHGGTNPTGALTVADDVELVTGAPLVVSAAQSDAGSYTLGASSFIWYLTAKPAGSGLRLSEEGPAAVTFVPDVAGTYTVEVVTVSYGTGGEFLVGDPASLDVVVVEAPAP